jgi:hypothetical protein
MTTLAAHPIDPLGVLAMHGHQHPVQAHHSIRHDHQVHMVRHEAKGDDVNIVISRLRAQQAKVGVRITGRMKDGLTMIATLGDVMWNSREDYAASTGHAPSLTRI